ncbi:hypothetical protein [Actinobacillus pleuropneumoniae]|uniref:hypothetical protein n=1 Tax=Actinobacillus pleuropneumoniae TaxID=715 RepID=UPI0000397BD9|nr:hypothetical protein [Actinobacillus pleuropneumoniae]UKH11263.1 DUF2213 domain-containing protein [Actinobacillus pleuropneumoniae]VTR63061.1 Uncharacterized protein conserved in bacteria [Actinobacillus pleuropneumoniae]
MKRQNIRILTTVNNRNISTETINGEEHIVVRDVVPIVDNVVMNGGLYPADEIDKSYQSMEGNLMPFGHPKLDGKFVSANDAQAVNQFHVGAWAKNVRKDGEKVLLDMYVNKRFAESSDNGKRLVERLESAMNDDNAEPIHVSTGLLLNQVAESGKSKGKNYRWRAANMFFDHVAILLDEVGAATPADGVGMFVNSQNEEFEVADVQLAEATNYTKEGVVNKVKFFFTANSDLSFEQIHRLLSDAIKDPERKIWNWIEAVYPNYFIYVSDGDNKRYKQKYLIDDNAQVNLVDERVEVIQKVEYDEIKTNGDNQQMKTKILNALNEANIATNGLSDDELLVAYNKLLQAEKAGKDEKKKDEEKPEDLDEKIKKAVNQALAPVLTQLNANADAEKAQMRQAVKAKFGLDDSAVNALDGDALKGLYAKTVPANALAGTFAGNSEQNGILNMEAPE